MISKNDIDKIQSLPIEQVADALGLKVKKHWSLCPFHSDSKPSLYYRVAKNKYRCYVCDHYGGPIDLTQEVMRLNFHDAVCWLAQTFGIIISEQEQPKFQSIRPREVKPVRKEIVNPFDPSSLAQLVAVPVLTEEARHFLFDIRKLDPRVINWCKISSTHTHLLIPYFGQDGSLQSVQWRYLGTDPKEPRFRFPKGSQCTIYNLQVLRLLKEGEPLFITEGASDCWSMLSSGHKAIAIPSATLLKPNEVEPLKGLNLHIFPDQDEPGERLFLQLRELFPNITRHQLPSGCKDFSDYYVKNACPEHVEGLKC